MINKLKNICGATDWDDIGVPGWKFSGWPNVIMNAWQKKKKNTHCRLCDLWLLCLPLGVLILLLVCFHECLHLVSTHNFLLLQRNIKLCVLAMEAFLQSTGSQPEPPLSGVTNFIFCFTWHWQLFEVTHSQLRSMIAEKLQEISLCPIWESYTLNFMD